ncbi:MAG TPA: hypothetical protein V6D18_18325 [Thermosynechococcaceae cyanobacterium]
MSKQKLTVAWIVALTGLGANAASAEVMTRTVEAAASPIPEAVVVLGKGWRKIERDPAIDSQKLL